MGIKIKLSRIESNNSSGSGEKHHGLLRRIYNEISMWNPNFTPDIKLGLAITAMSYVINYIGFVPSLLVFDVLLCFPEIQSTFPDQFERSNVMKLAKTGNRNNHWTTTSSSCFTNQYSFPAEYNFKERDKVLVYIEGKEPNGVDHSKINTFMVNNQSLTRIAL